MARIFLKSAFVGAALAAGLSAAALAHGPTRQKVVESVEINATPDKVWSVIGNFQDMSWLPIVKKTTGTGGNQPDVAKRQLDLGDGKTIDEELYKYSAEKHSYSYRIDKVDVKVLPVNDYSSTIMVTPEDDGKKSLVEWHGAFYRGYMNNDPPPELNDENSKKAVSAVYRTGLDALKKKLEATN
ncbi:SRPBCC family protein [Methylocella sp.]|uniref:SRPBCC family protein n=1 Tax=Methylocella sp. TaxID=1978226 RepID=UPI0037843895